MPFCGKKAATAALVLLQAPLLSLGQGNAPKIFDKEHYMYFSDAVCFVDVAQATFTLGQAGLYINDATKACPAEQWMQHLGPSPQPPMLGGERVASCSATVNEVLYSFGFVASYFASAASNCARTLNLGAYCAADVANLVADLNVVAAAGSDMKLTCARKPYPRQSMKEKFDDRLHAEYINSQTRRLDESDSQYDDDNEIVKEQVRTALRTAHEASMQSRGAFEAVRDATLKKQPAQEHGLDQLPGPAYLRDALDRSLDNSATAQIIKQKKLRDAQVNARRAERAKCAFNIGQVILFLYRAGVGLTGAVRDCPASEVASLGAPGSMMCSVDVAGFFNSLSFAAAALSLAIAECDVGRARDLKLDAGCSFDIASVVGAAAGVATSGSSFMLTCGKQALGERRLAADLAGLQNVTASLGAMAAKFKSNSNNKEFHV